MVALHPGSSWRESAGPDTAASRDWTIILWFRPRWRTPAYAEWAGRRLPTSRVGVRRMGRTRGNHLHVGRGGAGRGRIPRKHLAGLVSRWRHRPRRQQRNAPVGCHMPNGFGLHDGAGNVWELTATYWVPCHAPRLASDRRGRASPRRCDRRPARTRRRSEGWVAPVLALVLRPLSAIRPSATGTDPRQQPHRLPLGRK